MTSSSNKRAIGDKLENYILDLLSPIDPRFKKTANSGAKFSDGDIGHPFFVGECKVKSSAGFSSPLTELKKLKKISNLQGKDWLYFQQNINKEIMVLMDFNTFLEIYEKMRKNEI